MVLDTGCLGYETIVDVIVTALKKYPPSPRRGAISRSHPHRRSARRVGERVENEVPLGPMPHALGSRTSGVDGSSEGGRINTINLPGALVLYGVALIQSLQRKNPKTKLSVAPVQLEGGWCLQLSYQGDDPVGVPDHWHGHRGILRKLAPTPRALSR